MIPREIIVFHPDHAPNGGVAMARDRNTTIKLQQKESAHKGKIQTLDREYHSPKFYIIFVRIKS